jgi:hypothetical protein
MESGILKLLNKVGELPFRKLMAAFGGRFMFYDKTSVLPPKGDINSRYLDQFLSAPLISTPPSRARATRFI